MEHLKQEEVAVLKVIDLLKHKLRKAKAEIKTIQQDQEMVEKAWKQLKLQVESKLHQTLDKLQLLQGPREIKDMHSASPLEAGPSLCQLKKQLCLVCKHIQCRPTISPEATELIDILSRSGRDSGEEQTAHG